MAIFLSYRRADLAHALSIYPPLIQAYGPDIVFWDRKDIAGGDKFAEIIEAKIRSSAAFVAIIGENWLWARDEAGERLIDSPDDWIYRETTLALGEDLLVVPVLVGGMQAPSAKDLPLDMQRIAGMHMLASSDMLFHSRLLEALEARLPRPSDRDEPLNRKTLRLHARAHALLRRQTQRLQVRAVELVQDHKPDRAEEELEEGFELLMNLLDLSPSDITLDAQLGYLYATMAKTYNEVGNQEESERFLQLALEVFLRINQDERLLESQPHDVASAIKGIGEVYYGRGDLEEAVRHYRRALQIEPNYAYAWHDLLLALLARAREGQVDSPALRQALEKTRQFVGIPGIGALQIRELELALSAFDEATARQTLAAARAEGDDRSAGRALGSLAALAKAAGRINEAEVCANESIELLEGLGASDALARQYWLIGSIGLERGSKAQARTAYQRAREVYGELGNKEIACRVPDVELVGAVADRQREWADERQLLEAGIRSCDERLTRVDPDENPDAWLRAHWERGLAYLEMPLSSQSDCEEALSSFEAVASAIPEDERTGLGWGQVVAHRGKALRLLHKAGCRDEAVRCFDEAMKHIGRHEHPTEWASLMMLRGLAQQFPEDGSEPLPRHALGSYDEALSVFTSSSHPTDWQRIMFNRAALLAAQERPDRGQNLQRAVESYLELLVHDPGAYGGSARRAIEHLTRELVSLSNCRP